MDKLTKAREIIDRVDKEMAKLFTERMDAVRLVAEHKKELGLKIYDKKREDELIKKNSLLVEDPVYREYYVNFLKSNMTISKSYQSRLMEGMKVAFSGTEGAFAHIAAMKLFPTANAIGYPDFTAAYRSVEEGECDVAVLPMENSYNGEVGQVTDLMFSGSLFINDVIDIPITHDLLGTEGATTESIKEVVSHPQALAQCAGYISEKGYLTREFVNTALAARQVKEMNDPTVGAIASKEAAEIFGLKVVCKNINESLTNTTRFAVFSRIEQVHEHKNMGVHTILTFTVRNEAGALARAIDVIGKHGFNMRSLRSRPMKELLWQYYFYVEAEGNINAPEGKLMMEELMTCCHRLKSVGTFIKETEA